MLSKFSELEDDIASKESEIKQAQQLADSKRDMLNSPIDGVDLETLQEMLDKFDDGVEDQREAYNALRNDENQVKTSIADLRER